MATLQASFKWTHDKQINLIKCLEEFKSSREFRNCNSHPDKVKLYENVRKDLADIHEDEPDPFGPASVSENLYRDFLKLWLQPSLFLLRFQFSLLTFITPYNQPQRNNLLLIGDAREAVMTIKQPWKEGLNFHLRYIFI